MSCQHRFDDFDGVPRCSQCGEPFQFEQAPWWWELALVAGGITVICTVTYLLERLA